MRLILHLSLFLFTIISVQAEAIIFPGKIKNPVAQTVVLVCPPMELGAPIKKDTIALNEKNAFQFKFDSPRPFVAELIHGDLKVPVFIHPNQHVRLIISVQNAKKAAINFIGPGAKDNNFYLVYRKFIFTKEKEWLKQFESDIDKWYKATADYAKAQNNFLYEYQRKNKIQLSPALVQWVQQEIRYSSAHYLLLSPDEKGVDLGDMGGGSDDISSSRNFLFKDQPNIFQWKAFREGVKKQHLYLGKFNVINEEIIHHPWYQKFLLSYFYEHIVYWKSKYGTPETLEEEYNIASQNFEGKIKYYLQSQILKNGITNDKEGIELIYSAFRNSQAPLLLRQEIDGLYHKPKYSIEGKAFPISALRQINGNPIDSKLLHDKITYIFFWNNDEQVAKKEFYTFKRISKKFHEVEDVNILLVNTSGDPIKIAVGNQKYNLNLSKVKQLTLDPTIKNNIIGQYFLQEFSEFFVIGPRGKIISENCLPPSSNKVPKILRSVAQEYGLDGY